MLVLPGLAVPQVAFRSLARGLSGLGWGVLTVDYAGVGQSPGDDQTTGDDWVEDVRAAIEFARVHSGTQFLAVIGHSLGGQLVGQCSALPTLDGLLLVSAQRGMPRLFDGRAKARVLYAYGMILATTSVLGRLPPHRLTLPVAVPAGALRQWARWGLSGVYRGDNGAAREARFASYAGPITSVCIADDTNDAPKAAVEALLVLYARADIQRIELRPSNLGLDRIGHFGLFLKTTPAVTDVFHHWLGELETRAARNLSSPSAR